MLCAISNLYIYPQSVTFEHLTVEDGLAHNSGLCFVQDREGFLWIGTQTDSADTMVTTLKITFTNRATPLPFPAVISIHFT